MDNMLLLRVYVSERLTTAAEEILGVVELTVVEYQDEVSRLKKEVSSLRSQLDSLQPEIKLHRTVVPQHLGQISEEQEPTEQQQLFKQEQNPSLDQEDQEHTLIKEEREDCFIFQSQGGSPLNAIRHSASMMCQPELSNDFHPLSCPPLSPHCSTGQSDNSICEKDLLYREVPQLGLQTQKMSGALVIKQQMTHTTMKKKKCKNPSHLKFSGHFHASHSCRTCGKSYKTQGALRKHIQMHVYDAQPLCCVCEQRFESRDRLLDHLPTHAGATFCNICGQCFGSDTKLRRHMYSHAEEKPFKCSICNKSFTRREHLLQHIRIHTGERPYCCSFCGKGFTNSTQCRIHLRVHTGEKPYDCTVCGKCFSTSGQLKYHIRYHHR